MTKCNVAERIRNTRLEKGLTQTELAARCNVTKSLICKIEANKASLHLDLLLDIASALGVTVSELLEEVPRKNVTVMREKERRRAVSNQLGGKLGYEYYRLAGSKEAKIDAFFVAIGPESLRVSRFVAHDGFEFVFTLNGSLKVQFRDEDYVLNRGDSIFFDASKEHRIVPHQGEMVETLMIFVNNRLGS